MELKEVSALNFPLRIMKMLLADGWREINGTEYYFENYAMVKIVP